MAPKQTEIPDVSARVKVLVLIVCEAYVPAVVRRMRWKLYGASTSSPLTFVDVLLSGFGIAASLCPFLHIVRDNSLEVARSSLSHSSVTEVCVTLRSRNLGGEGDRSPKAAMISSCRSQNSSLRFCSSF